MVMLVVLATLAMGVLAGWMLRVGVGTLFGLPVVEDPTIESRDIRFGPPEDIGRPRDPNEIQPTRQRPRR